MKKLKLLLAALMLVAIASLYVSCPMDPDVGEKGPSGGLVFYSTEGWYECSDVLGTATWEDAKTLASNYRGGGYNDWRLPSVIELGDIYEDLYKPSYISNTGMFWSASEYNDDPSSRYAVARYFGSGKYQSGGDYLKSIPFNVRAVRRM